QRKAREEAIKEYEAKAEADKKKAEAEAKKAEEEAKRKADEEAMRKEQEKQMPDWYIKEKEAAAKRIADSNEMLKKLAESNELLRQGLEAMQKENTAFKAEKAAAERKNLILSKAKELGIPEYRIKEGFSIAEDADENAITDYLTEVSNNIKAFSLPSNREAFPHAGQELKKEEIDSIAKTLVI
ncbi:MAG: hypothetical protein II205_00430, partial [Bacteroidales bacterium]|nr:hypothetical protein [Bacteroidales bacterium]